MESSPSKRRKLSALTSIAPNAALEQSAPDSRQLTPNQASFLSPTKASLARFNPNLLPQVKSAGAKTKGPYGRSTAVSQEDVQKEGLRSFQDPVRSPLHPTTPTRNQMRVELTRVWSSSEERRLALLMVGVTASPTSKSSTRNRASASANPIPPSPASDSLQSIAQVSKTNERDAWYRATKESQSGSRAVSAPPLESEGAPTYGPGKSMQISEGEPALPLTPTQLGLEKAPEPPRGLLYSSPLRKMAKRKSSGLKSSPLKPRDDAPELLETACKEASQTCTREIVDSEHEGTDDLKKTRELEALREQLKGLQGDVDLLEQELGLLGASDWKDCSDLVLVQSSWYSSSLLKLL